MIPEGKHIAKITAYNATIPDDPAKKPFVSIRFETKPDSANTQYYVTWYGYLSPGAQKITLETLQRLGLSEVPSQIDEQIELMAELGHESNILKVDSEYELEVEHEPFQGKIKARVKWINAPRTFEKLARGAMKGRFSSLGLAATAAELASKKPSVSGPLSQQIPF